MALSLNVICCNILQYDRCSFLPALPSCLLFINTKNCQMKSRFILPLLATLFFSQALMAQFHIGAKAGANISKLDGQSFKNQFRYGYHVGAFAEIGLGEKFGLQPEVLFSQISTTLDSNYKNIYQDFF